MSPAKPCGKGSKRKQDDVDDEEEDDDVEEQQTWVEALSQELADDDGPEVDPDYEVGIVRGGRQGSKLCCVFFSPISFMQSCKFKVVKLTPETTRLVPLACGFNFSYRHEVHLKTWPLPFFLKPSSVETESEEYRSHNDTESDLEVSEKDVVIDDVNMVS